MLNLAGVLALIYIVLEGRKYVSSLAWCVTFALGSYFSYSFLWSLVTLEFLRTNLHGTLSNFTYSIVSVFNAYSVCICGVVISLATCAFLHSKFKGTTLKRTFGSFRVDTAHWFFMLLACYGLYSLLRNLYVAGGFHELVANRYVSDPLGTSCTSLSGVPLSIAITIGDKSLMKRSIVILGAILAIALFSGKTALLASALGPVVICYAAKNLSSWNWKGMLKTFGAVVFLLMMMQVYRTMRDIGEGGKQTQALQLQNSFAEVLVLSRVVEKTSQGDSFVGIEPALVPFYLMLPASLAGQEKDYYFTHWKVDHYVSRTYFDSIANMPITIYGDGYLMDGAIGVILISLFVGVIMYGASACFMLPNYSGVAVGLVFIGAIFLSARQGISEFTFTLVTGTIILIAVNYLDKILFARSSVERELAATKIPHRPRV